MIYNSTPCLFEFKDCQTQAHSGMDHDFVNEVQQITPLQDRIFKNQCEVTAHTSSYMIDLDYITLETKSVMASRPLLAAEY